MTLRDPPPTFSLSEIILFRIHGKKKTEIIFTMFCISSGKISIRVVAANFFIELFFIWKYQLLHQFDFCQLIKIRWRRKCMRFIHRSSRKVGICHVCKVVDCSEIFVFETCSLILWRSDEATRWLLSVILSSSWYVKVRVEAGSTW